MEGDAWDMSDEDVIFSIKFNKYNREQLIIWAKERGISINQTTGQLRENILAWIKRKKGYERLS